ncbi:MAG: hypothetical protein HYT68_02015 [Candidatus Zambryskibacteria bacterium]|nr:hypothetical protein [Candidatus Zambryskibacteria bacterium]
MNQFGDAFEAVGGNAKHLTRLGQSPSVLESLLKVLDGQGTFQLNQVVEVKAPEPKKIVPVVLKEVTSDGVSGKDGIKDLEKARYNVGNWAKDVMKQKAYVVVNGKTYKPVVLKGEDFTDDERVTSNIRKVAEEMGFITPPAELARLLRKSVSDEEIAAMGLYWLIVMHESITASDGRPVVLGLSRDDGGRWLYAYRGNSDNRWFRENGVVFLAPQE